MVKIHPKDSGPIDTHDHTHCDNCNYHIAVSGKYCYNGDKSKRKRKTKSWHTKNYNVCPKCKDSLSHYGKTVQCGNCRNYIDQMELINVSWNTKETKCPICDDEVTEENSQIVE